MLKYPTFLFEIKSSKLTIVSAPPLERTPSPFWQSRFHLDEKVELERFEEKKLGLPRESWGLDELRSALRNVSDVEWFEESGGMLNIRMLGPQRPSTFRRVFSRVPGAIYSCLKVCTRESIFFKGERGFFFAILEAGGHADGIR